MASKEDLSRLKISDLQQELESRGLESTGKKADLIERLWASLQMEKGESTQARGGGCEEKVTLKPEATGKGEPQPQVLLMKLRILKEREALTEREIELKAQLEKEQARIKARSEQLSVELELAEMGHVIEGDTFKIEASVTPPQSCDASGALAAHIQRVLLPPTDLSPFAGDVQGYHLFTRAFDSRIASKVSDKSELLYYLAQFTRGKPHQIVKGCLPLGGDGYDEARKLLDRRYGSAHFLVESYVERLRSWPRIAPGDVEGLDQLSLFLVEVQNAMSGIQKGELEHPRTLREVVQKLPVGLRDRWMREADRMMEQEREGAASVSFKDLVSFIQREVRILRNPVFGLTRCSDPVRSSVRPSEIRGSSHSVHAVALSGAKARCLFCQGVHHLDVCDKLRFKPYADRKAFISEKRLCFGCLQPGHPARFCQARLTCRICGLRHASLLHRTGTQESAVAMKGSVSQESAATRKGSAPPEGKSQTVVSAGVGVKPAGSANSTMMPVVPVRLRGKEGKEILTNAFLDQGSSGSFVTSRLAKQLGLDKDDVVIRIDTVTGEGQEVRSAVIQGARVGPVGSEECFALPPLFTLDSIPVLLQDRCEGSDRDQWEHLVDLPLRELDAPVDLMIGSNAATLLAAQEVRSPPAGVGPVGVRTCLGWYVIGPRRPGAGGDSRCLVNFLRVCEPRSGSQEDLADMFNNMYEAEFKDFSEESEQFSVSDRRWLKEVSSTIRKDDHDHYEVALPKVEVSKMPDSFPSAERRLEGLRNRFRKDPEYFEKYRAVINSLFEDGYAVRVPEEELDSGPAWYLPHHGVQEPGKGKLRVVFDCAARSGGICLNDLLKGGPNLTNSLIGVLGRFREGPIAFTCDIEAMYHRVHVPDRDSDLLRFLWFRDDSLDGRIEVWKMRSHVFGAVSSSSVASLALQQCAADGADQFPDASKVLVQNSYVDDVAVATASVDSAVKLAHDLSALCRRGAFNMRKFTSNSAAFLKEIPERDRGKNVKDMDLEKDRLKFERTLGLKWDCEGDSFCFEFNGAEKPVTRRGLLSTVSSIFDPLGIIAPVTLVGRALLRRLCAMSCSWDDQIPGELAEGWTRWLLEARQLSTVRLERDISGPPGVVLSTELHIFADASETAHAAVGYIRKEVEVENGDTEVFVNFVFGKSRLNPLRCVQSIPRLELAAATLAVKIKLLLLRELTVEFDRVRLWTDSLIVLSCIRNRDTRFKTFVANRLSLIHSASEVPDWSYVPSRLNPADVGSRGSRPDALKPWLEGPEFLSKDQDSWPEEPTVSAKVPDAEVKSSVCVCQAGLVDVEGSPSDSLVRRYSSFYRLKRAVAWLHRFGEVIRSGAYRRFCVARRRGLRGRKPDFLTVLGMSDLQKAETAVLRYTQTTMADYPRGLVSDGPVKVRKGSSLISLAPQMRGGLLVVGGRLCSSPSLSDRSKHPVIVPRRHHVARLLLREAHVAVGHQGRDHTLWKLRERYWIVGASSDVRKMIRSCVVCRKVNARPQEQLMASLPESRVTAGTNAFEKVGLDVFGPFFVKSGRSEKKRFGLMCTCLVTRAVHIEVLNSLTTDSLINAVRRISARRGAIRYVISDRGTNLVGADRELREAMKEVNHEQLHGESVKRGIHWEFSPPTASHFNGATERQIRTFRKIMASMPRQRMDDESLQTLFCEVESIMNSRPLNYVSTGDGNVEPISPNHLLLLRGNASGELDEFTENDSFSRRRWRQVQYLAGQFWRRWVSEYAPALQTRQKWRQSGRNLQTGDIVLIMDKNLPRGCWPLGKIVQVFPSADKFVRKVAVRTSTSTYLRPIHKLVLVHSNADLDW